jgi:transcriptional regulator with XRE-family HTH domain
MENIISELKAECEKNGTTISEVCRRAGVSRSIIERWKNAPPKSFTIYWSLKNALGTIVSEKQNAK